MFTYLRGENPQGVVSGYNPGSSLLRVEIAEEPDTFEGNSAFFLKKKKKKRKEKEKNVIAKHNLNKKKKPPF